MRHAMRARVCFIVRVRSWGCVRVRARARMGVGLSVCVRAHCQGAGREHGAAQRFSAVSGSANIKWQLRTGSGDLSRSDLPSAVAPCVARRARDR